MTNDNLQEFLDSTQNAMKNIKDIELSDEFKDMLFNKYKDMKDKKINQHEVFDYIHKDIEDHIAGREVAESFPVKTEGDASEGLKQSEEIVTAEDVAGFDTEEDEKDTSQVQENVSIDQESKQNDLDTMLNSEAKEDEKVAPKLLTKVPPKEDGFAYSPAINIVVLLLLFAFFVIAALSLT